jgi:hypothetical protein
MISMAAHLRDASRSPTNGMKSFRRYHNNDGALHHSLIVATRVGEVLVTRFPHPVRP